MLIADPSARDADLIFAVAEGDRAALAVLYERFAPRVLGIALRILQSQAEAEDLLHDLFLEVWQVASEFDVSRGTVETWLTIRARSRALDRRRHLARVSGERPRSAQGQPNGMVSPGFAEAGAELSERTVLSVLVRQALAAIPEEQREILSLAYFGGQTCQQMAHTLGLPLGTVKSRMAAGLGKLRGVIDRPIQFHGLRRTS